MFKFFKKENKEKTESREVLENPYKSLYESSLFNAIENGDLTGVKRLIESKSVANVECENFNGQTPLVRAASHGNVEIMEYLIKKGANPNHAGKSGWTALNIACFLQREKAIDLLLKHSPSLEIMGKALHSTFYEKRADLARKLIAAGADVNIYDGRQTTLIRAIWNDETELVEMLMEHGADVSLKNEDGESAVQVAVNSRSEEIIELFQTRYLDKFELHEQNYLRSIYKRKGTL